MERIIYISGKITGLQYSEACALFELATMELRDAGFTGQIVNPLKLGIPEVVEWHEAMDVCMRALGKCTTIYMLSNWKYSRGAKLELEFAVINQMEVFYQDNQRQLRQAFDAQHTHLRDTFCFKGNVPEIQTALILRFYGHDNQMLKAVEEMSKLIREIARQHMIMTIEGEESVLVTDAYVDELADVIIMVEQLKVGLFDLGFKAALECKIREKLARQIYRIQTEDVHRLSDYKHNFFGHE